MTRVVPLSDYVTLERPQLNWLIPDILPKPGMVLLLGEPFAGKSFLAFQLGLMLAQGGLFLHKKCRQSRVLYLQFDPSELIWRDRILAIQHAGVNLSGPLYMVHPDDNPRSMHILSAEHQQFLQGTLTAAQPDVVIVDVLREIHSCDEQDSTQMKQVGDALMQLFHGYTLIILHHTRKFDSEKPIEVINSSRGSSYMTGKADATWLIHQSKLHMVSRFASPSTHTMERLPCGLWRV
jgi:RecA-family ATPase